MKIVYLLQVMGFESLPYNKSGLRTAELLRFSGHPDLTNQESHNAQARPQNHLQIQ